MRPFSFALAFAFALVGLASADVEDVLLKKFAYQKRLDIERLRAFINDAATRAKELKDSDPERGVETLREAAGRIDGMHLLGYTDRKTMTEQIVALIAELREASLLKKRTAACDRLDAFRTYLESVAPDMRSPARSGDDHWEPAMFTGPAGLAQPGKLLSLGTGTIVLRYGSEERTVPPQLMPWVQVYGGFYVLDLTVKHQVFLTNREFYERIFLPAARQFLDADPRTAASIRRGDFERARTDAILQKSVDSGVFFLRGLPNLPAIPGVGDHEAEFHEFAAQGILQKGLPIPLNRIYPRDLEDTFAGYSVAQKSAIHRSLFLLRGKGVATSTLYAEILREETASLVRSEYPNFSEAEMNRVLFYVFDKLR